MNRILTNVLLTTTLLYVSFGATAANSETYPVKPVRIVVPAGAGGALDITTRVVAEKMSEYLGKPITVENRPGGELLVGTRYVLGAKHDGYTLLAQADGFTAVPSLRNDAGYDPMKDFTGIGLMLRAAQVMYTASGSPFNSAKEYVSMAAADPSRLSFAHGGRGSPMHLSGIQFVYKTGLNIIEVPYNGTAAAYPDIAAGRVDMMFGGYDSGISYIQSKKMKALAVTGDMRLATMPNVPTLKEQGVDLSYYFWLGLFAPSGTPPQAIQRLSEALQYALKQKDVLERYKTSGAEVVNLSPDQFKAFLKNEVSHVENVVDALKIEKK